MGFPGGCYCGAVRFIIDAEPVRAFQCQCRDCQKDSGGGHSSVLVFPRAALEISGEVRETARTSDRGAIKHRGFCPACGVSIYNKPDKFPELIGIYAGSLDDASRHSNQPPSSTPRADMPGTSSIPTCPRCRNGGRTERVSRFAV